MYTVQYVLYDPHMMVYCTVYVLYICQAPGGVLYSTYVLYDPRLTGPGPGEAVPPLQVGRVGQPTTGPDHTCLLPD